VRQFSSDGRSEERENTEVKETAPSRIGHRKKESKDDNTMGRPRKTPLQTTALSETGCTSHSDVTTPLQQHEQCSKPNPPQKSTELETKAISRKRKLQSTQTNATVELQDFDRLQLLKGKLIRKLDEQWLSYKDITETLEGFPYYLRYF
jgi:hypothetical protein